MNTYAILSLHDLKLQHLWTQHEHLHIVREYHLWMADTTADPELSELHRRIANQVLEAITHLDKIVKVLQTTSDSTTTETSSLPYGDASTVE